MIANEKGDVFKTGRMGFPVVGAIPDAVEYTVDLARIPAPAKTVAR